MLFLRFLFSKFFLKQLLLAFLVALGLIILSLRMLDKWTHNGQTQAVPDLQHLPLAIVDTLLCLSNYATKFWTRPNMTRHYPLWQLLSKIH